MSIRIPQIATGAEAQIRILGIKALKTTATADSRWVKGNIGVLLQLLDSCESEL